MEADSQDFESYWLWAWLESRNIRTAEQAASALANKDTLEDLRDVAKNWSGFEVKPIKSGHNLVPGTGLRLNDYLTCPNPKCRRRQVDVLFRHAWHYFDGVFLPDGIGAILASKPQNWSEEYLVTAITHLIAVMLHIRDIGASSLVHFYRQRTTEIGANNHQDCTSPAWLEVERSISNPSRYSIELSADLAPDIFYTDPEMQVSKHLDIPKNLDPDNLGGFIAEFAHETLHRHMQEFEEDLASSRMLGGALASSVWSHNQVLRYESGAAGASEVLFDLDFPSLTHVPIQELLSIRASEGDAFLAFRGALTRAANEMIANNISLDTHAIADQIRLDILEPELARIRQRLRSAQRALFKKSLLSISMTGVTTTCGVLGASAWGHPSAPAILAGGTIGGVGGGVLSGIKEAVHEYQKERATVEVSDMFFLWKALQHAA